MEEQKQELKESKGWDKNLLCAMLQSLQYVLKYYPYREYNKRKKRDDKLTLTGYISYLEKNLTPRRLEQSLGVMKTMEELATVYNLDRQKAALAGLLHDSAKELKSTQWIKLSRASNITTGDENIYDYDHYLHGPVGALLVQRDLGINDDDILGAIATHGYYGNWEQFNRPLSWCLRMADILEPGRDWSENRWVNVVFERLHTATYTGHLEESIQLWTKRLVEWYENDDVPVHPNIHQTLANFSHDVQAI